MTTEVPGLAEGLRRPGIEADVEIVLTDDVTAETLDADATLSEIVPILRRELGPGGASLDIITAGVTEAEGARRRTRIRALLAAVAGIIE